MSKDKPWHEKKKPKQVKPVQASAPPSHKTVIPVSPHAR
jgi:hypothetical protein